MKKILLINPPSGLYIRDDRCQSSVGDFIVEVLRPPHELLIIAATLRGFDCEVLIKDYPVEKAGLSDFTEDVRSFVPDVLLVNATLASIREDVICFQRAKEINSNILTVLRCGNIEKKAERIMREFDSIDLVLYGEADFTLRDYFICNDTEQVKGVFYKKNNKILKTEKRDYINSLDSLPFVERSLIDNYKYIRPDTGKPVALIEVSRGCPYACVFCLTPITFGRKVRYRSVKSVINEIRECVNEYGIRDFHFKSDLFSFDRDWVAELCNSIINTNLKINWFANSRVDSVDEKLLLLMRESGCFALSFGVESGSEYILEKIDKRISLDQVKKTFNLCNSIGIKVYAYFIIGFPWDDKNSLEETKRFAFKSKPTFVDFFIPSVFEGTKLYQIAEEMNLLDKNRLRDKENAGYAEPEIRSMYLSKKEISEFRIRALRAFYLKPGYIMKRFFECKSVNELYRLTKFGFKAFMKITAGV